jgi:hypothetical protein
MRKFRVYFLAVSSFDIRAITEKFILRGIQKQSVLKVSQRGDILSPVPITRRKKGQPQTHTRIMVQILTST